MKARNKKDIAYVFYSADLCPTTDYGFTLYRGVLVQWDEDQDTRILDWIDSLDDEIRDNLLIAHEREAGLSLRWKNHVPEGYKEGEQVDVGIDNWLIDDSRALVTAIPRYKNRLY